MTRKWHLVSYDVRDDKRLRQVAKLLEGYGERVQYSVFRCRLSVTELQRLRWELTGIVHAEDSILMIPLCEHCSAGIKGVRHREDWRDEPSTFVVV